VAFVEQFWDFCGSTVIFVWNNRVLFFSVHLSDGNRLYKLGAWRMAHDRGLVLPRVLRWPILYCSLLCCLSFSVSCVL
jgi:hypothetical protein